MLQGASVRCRVLGTVRRIRPGVFIITLGIAGCMLEGAGCTVVGVVSIVGSELTSSLSQGVEYRL